MTNEVRFELGRVTVVADLSAAPAPAPLLPWEELPASVEAPASVRFTLGDRTLAVYEGAYLYLDDDDRGTYYGGVEEGHFVREDGAVVPDEDARRLIALAAFGEEDDAGDVYAAIHEALGTLCWEAADVMGEALDKAIEALDADRALYTQLETGVRNG